MSALRAYRTLLQNGPLSRLLAGEFVSGIGDWLYLVALLIVVYERSEDAVLLGLVGAARVLPYVLLSVPAGIVADRFDRRLVLIVTDTARAVIMVGLAWLVATNGSIEAIVGLAILATCFSTFFGPTIGAYLPALVRDERELGPANSAWALLDSVALVIGPVVAGVLVALGGLTTAFLLNALSFVFVGLILWRLPPSRGSVGAPFDEAAEHGDGETADGLASAAQGATGRVLIGLGAVDVMAAFVFGGVSVLTVYLATTTYGAGDEGTGYLNAAMGVGGLVGAGLSSVLLLRPNQGAVLVGGAIAAGLGVVALGVVSGLAGGLIALTIASAGSLLLDVTSTTIFQRAVPDRLRGRMLGLIATASMLAFSAGSFFLPVLVDAFGVARVLAVSGVAIGAVALGGRVLVGSYASRPLGRFDGTVARIRDLPLFAGISPARLEAAMGRLEPRPVADGEIVIRQGDPADRFYIINSGRVRVTQNGAGGERVLRDMGPDEVFGEIGLLRNSARTATVTAVGPGLLLALDRDDFLELVAAEAHLGSVLLDLHRGTVAGE